MLIVSENLKKIRPNRWLLLLGFDWGSKVVARVLGRYQTNLGIGLGLFNQLPTAVIIISGLLILTLWHRLKSPAERLILTGGIANLVDRLVNGKVTDWIYLPGVSLWLNPADIYISLGLVWFILAEGKIVANETANNL